MSDTKPDLKSEWKFNPKLETFDLQNAQSCARAAYLAYESPGVIIAQLRKWGFSERVFLDINDTQVYVARREATILVAFRGTEARVIDLLTDARFKHVAEPLGDAKHTEVHGGFQRSLEKVWSAILGLVPEHRDPEDMHVWFTGHSLGGALAELAAGRSLHTKLKVSGIYTFGKPRACNVHYQTKLDVLLPGKIYNVVNDRDIVPCVPPVSLRFSHPGKPFILLDPKATIDADGDGRPDVQEPEETTFERIAHTATDLLARAASVVHLDGLARRASAKVSRRFDSLQTRFERRFPAVKELKDLLEIDKEEFEDHRMVHYIDGLDKNRLKTE